MITLSLYKREATLTQIDSFTTFIFCGVTTIYFDH